jgi:hypothetical protein
MKRKLETLQDVEISVESPLIDGDANLRVSGPALGFAVHSGDTQRARCSTLTLPHGQVQTPVFMPVGTQGTIKGLTCGFLFTIAYIATVNL